MLIKSRPFLQRLRKQLIGRNSEIESTAIERWEIAAQEVSVIKPAIYLPNQIDRIRDVEFETWDFTLQHFKGGYESVHKPTLGFRLVDVDLIDGVLYSRTASRFLGPHAQKSMAYRAPSLEIKTAAFFESWAGNEYFGNWLMDDCLTYFLAAEYGKPVTSRPDLTGHRPEYQAMIGMAPDMLDRAHFDELIIFEDAGHNENRKLRLQAMQQKLRAGTRPAEAPGVFILRGSTGAQRILSDERAIAEKFAETYGFRIIDPIELSVKEIVEACSTARIIAGVEGSHLAHGIILMQPSTTLFVLQPPERCTSVLKYATDRQDVNYAFVVGFGSNDNIIIPWEDIAATMELINQ